MQGTDKKILLKGVKYMAMTLPLMFLGPIIIHSSFKNQGHPLYYVVLGLGIGCCITAIFLFIRGLQTIMRSIFGK